MQSRLVKLDDSWSHWELWMGEQLIGRCIGKAGVYLEETFWTYHPHYPLTTKSLEIISLAMSCLEKAQRQVLEDSKFIHLA